MISYAGTPREKISAYMDYIISPFIESRKDTILH